MKLKAAFILVSGILLFLPPALFAEELTITTYYPSPYGSYNELQLYPHNPPVTDCNNPSAAGTMYYTGLPGKELLICDGQGNWLSPSTASEFWSLTTDSSGDIYNINARDVRINKLLLGVPGTKLPPVDPSPPSLLTVVNGGVSIGYPDVQAPNGGLIVGSGGVNIGFPTAIPPAGGLIVQGQVGIGRNAPDPTVFMDVRCYDPAYDYAMLLSSSKEGIIAAVDGVGRTALVGLDLSPAPGGTALYAHSQAGYDIRTGDNAFSKDGDWVTSDGYSLRNLGSSDRNMKENFSPVDSQAILAKISQLPITQWNFKSDAKKARHIGPVSQDFHALFGTGADDKHIAFHDTSGVALAGIKALNQKIEAQGAEIQGLKERIKGLEEELQVKP